MSFIDELRTLVSNAIVERFENDENIHAVQYKKTTILSSFDGIYSVEVVRIENYNGDKVRPDALAVLIDPRDGDCVVYHREYGWVVTRRDGATFFNKDSSLAPPEPLLSTAPVTVETERVVAKPFNPPDDDDIPF